MSDTPTGDDHLDILLKEVENFEKILRVLLECHASASVMRRAHKEYYSHAVIKLDQINKYKRGLQEELYSTYRQDMYGWVTASSPLFLHPT